MKKRTIICFLLLIAFVFGSCSSVATNETDSKSNTLNSNPSFSQSSNTSSSQSNNTSSSQSTSGSLENGKPKNKLAFLAVKEADGIDEAAVAFGIDMLKAAQEEGRNCMISPLSILTALGMTANGADSETLKQMEEVLFGGKSIEEFNEYYKALINRITNPKNGVLKLANSTWYRNEPNRLKMNDDFLAKIREIFDSEVKPADFNDQNTVNLINKWVKENTNGYIDRIIGEIDTDTIIYLINALYFEQKWAQQYSENKVVTDIFHTGNGDVDASFMYSDESVYIHDDAVQGFIKPYEGNEFSFVALLPKEGVTPEEYLSELTGKKMLDLLKNKKRKNMRIALPKFKAEFEASLVKPLESLGITELFDSGKANLKKMAVSSKGNIFVSNVVHKTFIEVNEAGTKAAAVTAVIVKDTAVVNYDVELTFDRPFIYMIIDNQTNLPLFIGILNNPAN